MTDFLEEKKREINARLKELKPLVDEYHRLEAAAAALDGVGGSAPAASGSTRAAGGTSRRGRRAGRRRQRRRKRASRTAPRQRHALEAGARARPRAARHLHPGDGPADGHP